jgi:predicted CXXCH cytochrome family protein
VTEELFDPTTTPSGLGGTIDADMLFTAKVECASCHDVHDSGFPSLLVMDNAASALCLTCHDK